MKNISVIPLLLAAILALASCAGDVGAQHASRLAGGSVELTVRRGDLRPRLLLTGELVASRAEELTVPRTPTWQAQIRSIAQEGSPIKAGQPVVELDNSAFTTDLEQKRLAAAEAANELDRKQAETRTQLAEKEFAVLQKRTDLDKARIAATVPEGLLSPREHQERQLAQRRAEVELAKAEDDLSSSRKAGAADLEVQRINLRRARREIQQAETAIQAFILRAPRDGIMLVKEHPWEGRKYREGDTVFVGWPVASLPDLTSLIVEADLPDVDDGRIRRGLETLCTLDAYPGETFRGRVVKMSAVAQETMRRPLLRFFTVEVQLERLDPQRMRPGMSVRVEVLQPAVRNALLAPRAGLDLGAKPPRALLAGGGTAELKLGACSAAECVVEQGLDEGTRLRPRAGGIG